jgi:hypothetical protein
VLAHASAFNFGLWLRTLVGVGTPRSLRGRLAELTGVLTTLSTRVAVVNANDSR